MAHHGSSKSKHMCLPCSDLDSWWQLLLVIAQEIDLDGSLALLHEEQLRMMTLIGLQFPDHFLCLPMQGGALCTQQWCCVSKLLLLFGSLKCMQHDKVRH